MLTLNSQEKLDKHSCPRRECSHCPLIATPTLLSPPLPQRSAYPLLPCTSPFSSPFWNCVISECDINGIIYCVMGFPDSSVGNESACNAGEPSLIPGLGRSAGEGKGYLLQCSWASPVAQMVRNLPAMQETWVGKIPWRRERLPTPVFWPGEFHGLYSAWGHKGSDTTG